MDYYSAFRGPNVAANGLSGAQMTWARMVHISVLVGILITPVIGGIVGPMIVMFTEGERAREVDEEAVEAFNFGITASFAMLIPEAIGLMSLGAFGDFIAGVFRYAIWITVGFFTIRARHFTGEIKVRYPFSLRVIKPVWTAPTTRSKKSSDSQPKPEGPNGWSPPA